MKKLIDLYESITPKTEPEALAEKIISMPEEKHSSKRIPFRPVTAFAAAAVAMSALVVTAGAANDWDYGAFFESLFGDKSQNITESIISPATEICDTIDAFDFEIVAAAADKHSILAIIDVISYTDFPDADWSDGVPEEVAEYIFDALNFSIDTDAIKSSTSSTFIDSQPDSNKIRLRICAETDADITGKKVTITAYNKFNPDGSEIFITGNENCWKAEFIADYTAAEVNYNLNTHLETIRYDNEVRYIDVTDITITPLTLYIEGTGTGDYFATMWNYEDRYVVTDSGEKIYFSDASTASASSDDYTYYTEKLALAFETPVNPEDITAIILNGQTIELK